MKQNSTGEIQKKLGPLFDKKNAKATPLIATGDVRHVPFRCK